MPSGLHARAPTRPGQKSSCSTYRAFLYTGTKSPGADLAYALPGDSAQGATVHTGIALNHRTSDRRRYPP